MGTAGAAAANHPVAGGNLYMDVRGEPVRQIADHGEPTARIQEITDGVADRHDLEPFDRALFAAAERSLVNKGVGGARTLVHGTCQGNTDGCVRAALAVELVLLSIGYAIHFERVVQLEDRGADVVGSREGYLRGGFEGVWAGSSWASITYPVMLILDRSAARR